MSTTRIGSGRGAARPAEKAGRAMHPATWSFLALFVCLGLLAAVLSGRFTVRHVDVIGQGLPKAEIEQVAAVDGQNIFTVRSDELVGRLSSVHQIVVQKVETSFPDRVTIYARMRVAMVAWRRGNALYLLDPDGQVIKQVGATNLPIISSTATANALGPGVVEAVQEAVKLVPSAPNGAIAAFQYSPQSGLTVVGRAGWQAIIGNGSAQTLVNRVATLASVLEATKDHQPPVKLVDLRYRGAYLKYG